MCRPAGSKSKQLTGESPAGPSDLLLWSLYLITLGRSVSSLVTIHNT